MSLNKHLRISLKIRLALTYTIFFFISCVLIFSISSWRVYQEINRMTDEELCRTFENISESYHNSLQQSQEFFNNDTRDEYPQRDLQILEKRFAGMELLAASRQEGVGASGVSAESYYTAKIFHRGKYYECRVRKDGSIYSKQIRDFSHFQQLRKQLHAAADPRKSAVNTLKRRFRELDRSYGQSDFFAVILDDESNAPLMRAGAVVNGVEKLIDAESIPMTGFEISRFRCIYNDIPEVGRFIAGYSIMNRDRVIRQYLVIFAGILLSGTGIGIAVAWLIARRFIRGIKQTTLAMKSISGGDYSYRIAEIPYNDEEIVTLMETFNDMNERTENLLKDIKMMSDNVAHDLRTPLTRISGTVELLLSDRELSEKVRDVCVSVLEETLRLKALVNTIMDISRTTAHPDSLKKEQVDISRIVRNFCDFMLPAFEEKSLQLTTVIPEGKIMVELDKTMFQRMLANLIENALKFTVSGGVDIKISVDSGNVILNISDTGCGISAQDLPHIFDRFYRADTSRHLSGNGLGLALVKAVADAHKWKIEVDSSPGNGTAFIITMLNLSGA